MVEIIPSINHPDPAEIRRRIKLVEPYVDWVHVDVSDGIFGSVKAFNEPAALYDFRTSVNIELHLMIDKPEEHLDEWLKTHAARFWMHIESTKKFDEVLQKIARQHKETGLALHPHTPAEAYTPHANTCRHVMVLGVIPGPSGQSMQPGIIEKISTLRKAHPHAIIEADGAISLPDGTAKQAVEAGADILVSGHDIFSSQDIPKAIEQFRNLKPEA